MIKKDLQIVEAWVPCSAAPSPLSDDAVEMNYIVGISDIHFDVSFYMAHHDRMLWIGDDAYTRVQVLRLQNSVCFILVLGELLGGERIIEIHKEKLNGRSFMVAAISANQTPEDPAEEPTRVAGKETR